MHSLNLLPYINPYSVPPFLIPGSEIFGRNRNIFAGAGFVLILTRFDKDLAASDYLNEIKESESFKKKISQRCI